MTEARQTGRSWISKVNKFALIPLKAGDRGKARRRPLDSAEQVKYSLANFTMTEARQTGRSWISKVNKFALIPLETGDREKARSYRRVMTLINPKSSLAKLFFPNMEMFPKSQFFEHHRTSPNSSS